MLKPIVLLLLLLIPFSVQAEECVILLHGLARTPRSMSKVADHLQKNGFTPINVGYASTDFTIQELSEQALSKGIQESESQHCDTLHFVTHSMGGILVRDYLSKHSVQKLGRVVMLAPPNQGSEIVDKIGSWKVFKLINGPAGVELGTDTLSTPNRLGKADFELGIIAGDRSINLINSIMIKGTDDGKVSIENTKLDGMKDHLVIHSTHTFMMRNKEVLEHILFFLNNGSFEKPSDS